MGGALPTAPASSAAQGNPCLLRVLGYTLREGGGPLLSVRKACCAEQAGSVPAAGVQLAWGGGPVPGVKTGFYRVFLKASRSRSTSPRGPL